MIKQLAFSTLLLSHGLLHAQTPAPVTPPAPAPPAPAAETEIKAPEAKSKAPERDAVAQEIAALIRAVYTPDFKLLIKHTHDKVLELAGGKKAFMATLQQTHDFLKKNNVSVKSVAVGKKLDHFESAENQFFFISTKIILQIGEKEQAAPGHQLGVKKKGTDIWKYIDCSALNDELLRTMFPDFPKDKTLPAK